MQEDILPAAAPMAAAPEETGPRAAGFNERFIAYVIDALPFVLGAYWTMGMMIASGNLANTMGGQLRWKLVWIAFYLAYETWLSSGGRATVGKWIMGIRVRDKDGSDLSIPKAFFRSVGYFISSIPVNLGYVVALFTPKKRALHDYIGGSRVISIKERGDFAQGAVFAVSWSLMLFFGVTWLNQTFLAMTPSEKRLVAQARRGVNAVAKLQEMHMASYGVYTEDIKRLAAMSGDVQRFRRELVDSIDPSSLVIATDGSEYVVKAKAKNWRKTEVAVSSLDKR
ncbi:MAG: RDD family protein [Elusimicrobiales bacterium]|nr:RDD family protein [Elusimicrobiales bacterium]